MANQYDGPYRLTTVNVNGLSASKKIWKWSDAYKAFLDRKQRPLTQYAVLVELSEDPVFARIVEEFKR